MFDADRETAADLLLPVKKRLPVGRYLGELLVTSVFEFVRVTVSLLSLESLFVVNALELLSFDDFVELIEFLT